MLTQTIRASKLKAGMVLSFQNARFNTRIDDVQHGANGGVLVYTGDGTASTNYRPDENVSIVKRQKPTLKQVMDTYKAT